MKIIKNGDISSVPGIKTSGINCGLKKNGKDLGLIVSDVSATAAGVFTTNLVQASPVRLSKELIKSGKKKAIIVNSGNANACTGKQGDKNCETMVAATAKALGVSFDDILVASTGKIGEPLPVDKIKKGIPLLVKKLSNNSGQDVAEAILTTDKVKKSIAVEYEMDGKKIVVGAVAKGSGMIRPDMATMLAFITTNVSIRKSALKKALKKSVDASYNMITVDGDMSTNDSVMCLANGVADNKTVTEQNGFNKFVEALTFVNSYLAKEIVRDGEGATKFVEVFVYGAKKDVDAKTVAFSIANSSLVKTAIFGEDPNWGRIFSAAGASGVSSKFYDFSKTDIWFGNCHVVKKGIQVDKLNQAKVRAILQKPEIKITIDLKAGKYDATVWTSDLSYEYVKINAEYST